MCACKNSDTFFNKAKARVRQSMFNEKFIFAIGYVFTRNPYTEFCCFLLSLFSRPMAYKNRGMNYNAVWKKHGLQT